jgi:membrane protein YqaA with SNARE-associated domain
MTITSERRRYWTAFVLALATIAVAGGVLMLVEPSATGLVLLTAYCIPTNSILPLPHEPGLLYFAQSYDPIWISLCATTASAVTSFADYALVEAWLRHPRLGAIQHARLFRWAVRWMRRWPFAIVVVFSAAPLPISVVRILAPASSYPISRYVVAQAIGRLPRFYAVAWLGSAVAIPPWVLAATFVLTFGLLLVSNRE